MRWISGHTGRFARGTAAVLACLLMAGSCGAVPGDDAAPGGQAEQRTPLTGTDFVQVAAENGLALYVHPATGEFYAEDGQGRRWHSNPPEREKDEIATGFNRTNMDSALIIHTINSKRVVDDTNSTIASVNKGGLTAYRTAGGAVLEYHMPSEKITIPLSVTLAPGGLEVSILTREIREEGDLKLVDCTLLPYMGSAGPDDTGYVILPDGCGTLVEFSPGQTALPAALSYKKTVYGRDAAFSSRSVTSRTEKINLPVFATKTEDTAVLGVVTQGDALTALELFPKGQQSQQTAVHPIMTYRNVDTTIAHEGEWNEKQITIYGTVPTSVERYTVRYYLMGTADYSEIAAQVADHYMAGRDAAVQRPAGAQLTVQMLGAVRKPDTILGIPIRTVYAATTYRQAEQLLEGLKDAGVREMQLVYHGMFAGGLYDKMPVNAQTEGKLGSGGDLKALQSYLRENGIGFYPAADLSAIYRSGNGVSYKQDAIRDVGGGVRELTDYFASTYVADEDGRKWTLLKPGKTGTVYRKFTAALVKKGFATFADVGVENLASNNHRPFFGENKGNDRETAKEARAAAVQTASEQLQGYMAENAAAYLLPYTTDILNAPSASSRQLGFGREIPFYQLVASRFARISSRPVNFETDETAAVLRTIEYGMIPSAYFCGSDTSALANTDANWLYAADGEKLTARCAAILETYGEALRVIAASPMTAHRQTGERVYETTYASGEKIVVDYGNGTVAVKPAA